MRMNGSANGDQLKGGAPFKVPYRCYALVPAAFQ